MDLGFRGYKGVQVHVGFEVPKTVLLAFQVVTYSRNGLSLLDSQATTIRFERNLEKRCETSGGHRHGISM